MRLAPANQIGQQHGGRQAGGQERPKGQRLVKAGRQGSSEAATGGGQGAEFIPVSAQGESAISGRVCFQSSISSKGVAQVPTRFLGQGSPAPLPPPPAGSIVAMRPARRRLSQ